MSVILHFRSDKSSIAELASKAERVDCVGRMQADLASASEAEKSAVLATSEKDAQDLAEQARAGSTRVEQERTDMGELLTLGGGRQPRGISWPGSPRLSPSFSASTETCWL
jgi:hypothetical protein